MSEVEASEKKRLKINAEVEAAIRAESAISESDYKPTPQNPWLNSWSTGIDDRIPYLSINPNYCVLYKRKPSEAIDDDKLKLDIAAAVKAPNILELFPDETKQYGYSDDFVHPINLINSGDNRNENLKKNKINPYGSKKSSGRIKLALNWLQNISKKQKVFCEELKKDVSFTLNHFTLTLPCYQVKSYTFKSGKKIFINDDNPYFNALPCCIQSVDFNYTDKYIKHELLNHFLTDLRRTYHVDSYVWRAETQENGNIHFHITTNQFIYLSDLRNLWNKVLGKTDMLESYHKKFSEMTFEQYKTYRNRHSRQKHSKLLAAYKYGKSTDWYSPNSTDVHAVWKINNITAYLAEYFTKKQLIRRRVEGCLWRLSELLSKLKKEVVFAVDQVAEELAHLWKYHPTKVKCKEWASIFCFKISDIKNIIPRSVIVEKFLNYRNKIFENYNQQKQLQLIS